MPLDTRHLRLVVAVARAGTLARAARQLHLTPSALSHQLRALEAQLGVCVFHRAGRSMTPTAAGRPLLDAAERALTLLDEAESQVRRLARGDIGTLRLGTQCYHFYYWLPRLLRDFHAAHPGVEVEVVGEDGARPTRSLLKGVLDLAIAHRPVRHPSLEEVPLFADELLAVMHPHHPLATRAHLEARDFADQRLFVFRLPAEEGLVFRRVLTPAGVAPRQVTQVQLTDAMLDLVRGESGIAVLPRWAIAPELGRGELAGVRLTERGLRRRWRAMHRRGEASRGPLATFVGLLARGFPGAERRPWPAHATDGPGGAD
jgi:LysR family transcriptional regulator for metE and metH